MTKTETRQSKRTPVTLKIKFKSATLDQFIERYAIDVSQGGIFIRTKDPLKVGTTMRFEFQLRDASPLITGEGTVVWIREHSPNQAGVAPGMGVRFDRLTESSQAVLDQILAQKGQRGPDELDQSFAETPTRVAPAPLVDDLAKVSKNRHSQSMSAARDKVLGKSPAPGNAPKAVPFRSDADEFSEEAFEQATRVHSLEDLAAASMRMGAVDEPLVLGTAGGTEEEEEDLPVQAGDGVVLGAAGAVEGAGTDDLPSVDDAVMLGAAGATEPAGTEEVPSQTDDRAQTTVFPSKNRIRPMLSLGGAASHPLTSDPAGDSAGDPERTNPRVSMPAEPDVEEPTAMREPGASSANMAASPAAEREQEEPAGTAPDVIAEQPEDGEQDRHPAGDAASEVSGTTEESKAEGTGEAQRPTGRIDPDREPAGERAPSDMDFGAEDEDDDEGLTTLLTRPEEEPEEASAEKAEPRASEARQPARSRLPVFLAAAVVVIGLAGGYLFFTPGGNELLARFGLQPAGEAAGDQSADELAPEAELEPEPEAELEAEPEAELEIEPEAAIEIEPEPAIETAQVIVRSAPEGALATLVDAAQEGPTPMTFEVDAAKPHRVRISHPGYVSEEITIDPDEPEVPRVELEPAPWVVRFTSTPDGAVVYVDGRRVPGTTPNEMELPPGWEKRRHYKISFRLAHHEKLDLIVDNQFEAESKAMVLAVEGTMVEETAPPAHAAPRHAHAATDRGKQKDEGSAGDKTQEAAKPGEQTGEGNTAGADTANGDKADADKTGEATPDTGAQAAPDSGESEPPAAAPQAAAPQAASGDQPAP